MYWEGLLFVLDEGKSLWFCHVSGMNSGCIPFLPRRIFYTKFWTEQDKNKRRKLREIHKSVCPKKGRQQSQIYVLSGELNLFCISSGELKSLLYSDTQKQTKPKQTPPPKLWVGFLKQKRIVSSLASHNRICGGISKL